MQTHNSQYSNTFSLEEVSAKFKQWRLERHKQGKLPDFLWHQALGLLNKYNKTEICRELRISGSQINTKLKLQSNLDNTICKPADFVSINMPEVTEKVDIKVVDKIEIKCPSGTVFSIENLNYEILTQLLSKAMGK